MDEGSSPEGQRRDEPTSYNIADARRQFSELVARAEAGEEIVISRGNHPACRLVPLARHAAREPGILKRYLKAEQLKEFEQAMDTPLTEEEQRILEGEGTDDVGIWIGLPEHRQGNS
jgi:prevent-host-death family protein